MEFAWKVHAAQEAWTAKVDGKAAITFTVELALLAALIAAHGHGKLIDRMHGAGRVLAEIGTAMALLSALCAGMTVMPRLGSRVKNALQSTGNFIYFGHTRHWKPADLRDRIARLTQDEELDLLSRQLVVMSELNWAKHRWMQLAMVLALASFLLVGITVVVVRP